MIALLALLVAASPSAQACAFDPDKGIVSVAGQPAPQFEAGRKPAFAGTSFTYAGATYARFGAPLQLTAFELEGIEAMGEKESVPLFMQAGDDSVLYVMVKSADCTFQRYGKE